MNPFFYACARLRARRALHAEGHSFTEINRLMDGCEDDVIDGAVEMAGVKASFGDGPIIAAIIAFFQSAQGQEIIAALVKILLSLLAV